MKYLALIIIFLLNIPLYAQDWEIYLGGEVGLTYSTAYYTDTGNEATFRFMANYPPLLGGQIGGQFRRKIWGELGFFVHDLGYRDQCLRRGGCGVVNTRPRNIESVARFGYDLPIFKRKFYFSPHLGYKVGFIRGGRNDWFSYIADSSHFSTGKFQNSPYVEGEINDRLHDSYHLLETGLQLSYLSPESWRINLFGRYAHGFRRISENRFYYEFPDGSSGNAVFWQNGGYWMWGVSVNYYIIQRQNRA